MKEALTTKAEYKINYSLINKKYDFYLVKFSGEKNQFKRDREAFYKNIKNPIISFGFCEKPTVFCVPKNVKINPNSDFYKIIKYNDIKEVEEDTLLNLIAKISYISESGFVLMRDLFYFIKAENKGDILRGCEPNFKKGCIEVNVVSYIRYDENNKSHIKSNADRVDITKNKGGKNKNRFNYVNNPNGNYIKKGKNNSSKFNVKVIDYGAVDKEGLKYTKVAVYNSFIKMLNNSGFIDITLKRISVDRFNTLKTTEFINNSANLVRNKLLSHGGINIINHSKKEGLDKNLKNFLSSVEIKKSLQKYIDKDKIFINAKDKSIPQLWIHEAEEDYKNKKEDPYEKYTKETVKQSITNVSYYMDSFNLFEKSLDGEVFDNQEKRKFLKEIDSFSIILRKCLHELCIKLDIKYNEPPTFIEKFNKVTGWATIKVGEEDWVFKYSDKKEKVEVNIDNYICQDSFKNIKENEYLVQVEDDVCAKIEKEDYKIIPDFNLAEEIMGVGLNSSEGPLPIERKEFVKYAELIDNQTIYERLNENKKPYFEKKDILEIFKTGGNNSWGGRNKALVDFSEYFNIFPTVGFRRKYKGKSVADPYKCISYFGNGVFSVGELANTNDIHKMQPVFKITLEKEINDDDYLFDLIKKLYAQYFIKLGYATRKPYFCKYIREAYNMDSYF